MCMGPSWGALPREHPGMRTLTGARPTMGKWAEGAGGWHPGTTCLGAMLPPLFHPPPCP